MNRMYSNFIHPFNSFWLFPHSLSQLHVLLGRWYFVEGSRRLLPALPGLSTQLPFTGLHLCIVTSQNPSAICQSPTLLLQGQGVWVFAPLTVWAPEQLTQSGLGEAQETDFAPAKPADLAPLGPGQALFFSKVCSRSRGGVRHRDCPVPGQKERAIQVPADQSPPGWPLRPWAQWFVAGSQYILAQV